MATATGRSRFLLTDNNGFAPGLRHFCTVLEPVVAPSPNLFVQRSALPLCVRCIRKLFPEINKRPSVSVPT